MDYFKIGKWKNIWCIDKWNSIVQGWCKDKWNGCWQVENFIVYEISVHCWSCELPIISVDIRSENFCFCCFFRISAWLLFCQETTGFLYLVKPWNFVDYPTKFPLCSFFFFSMSSRMSWFCRISHKITDFCFFSANQR